MEKFYTVKEVARMLNRSPKTIYGYAYKGKLRVRKIGGWLVRITAEEYQRFAKTLTCGTG